MATTNITFFYIWLAYVKLYSHSLAKATTTPPIFDYLVFNITIMNHAHNSLVSNSRLITLTL